MESNIIGVIGVETVLFIIIFLMLQWINYYKWYGNIILSILFSNIILLIILVLLYHEGEK